MNDEEIRSRLRSASLPDPVGGHEAARERLMGRVRHRYPPGTKISPPVSRLARPLIASISVAGLALAVFLAWPEQKAEADALPTEAQMQRFYDQHEVHHNAHLAAQDSQEHTP